MFQDPLYVDGLEADQHAELEARHKELVAVHRQSVAKGKTLVASRDAELAKVTAELTETRERLAIAEASLTRYQAASSTTTSTVAVAGSGIDIVVLPALQDAMYDVDFRGSVRSLLAAAGSRNARGRSKSSSTTAQEKGHLVFKIKSDLSALASRSNEAFAETTTTATFFIRLFMAAGFPQDRVMAEVGGYPASFTCLELQKLDKFMHTPGTLVHCIVFSLYAHAYGFSHSLFMVFGDTTNRLQEAPFRVWGIVGFKEDESGVGGVGIGIGVGVLEEARPFV